MKISFAIPAYNEELYIAACLQSIADLRTDPWVHEVIVVDNGSTDRTAEIAASFPGVRVVREPRKGLSFARQKALDVATGDLLACIDADTRVSADWLKTVQRHFEGNNIDCLIGSYEYYDLAAWKWRLKKFADSALWFMRSKKNYATGGNTVYRIETLRAAGGFNTNIPFYGEDVDTMMRMRRHGRVTVDEGLVASSSARRMNAEGFFKILVTYKLNSMWEAVMKKPLLVRPAEDWRPPSVTVVVPAYNEERRIAACLRSALESCTLGERIVVVDNGSTDRTAEIAASFPGVTVIRETRKGVAWARQAALDRATTTYVVSLDADTLLTRRWLDRAVRLLESRPDAACATGPYWYFDLPLWERCIHFTMVVGWDVLRTMFGFVQLTGGNAIYRTEALRRCGGFERKHPFWEEDLYLAIRLRAEGKILYRLSLCASSSGRRLKGQGFFTVLFYHFSNLIFANVGAPSLIRKPSDRAYR